jgi:hypothetical protein
MTISERDRGGVGHNRRRIAMVVIRITSKLGRLKTRGAPGSGKGQAHCVCNDHRLLLTMGPSNDMGEYMKNRNYVRLSVVSAAALIAGIVPLSAATATSTSQTSVSRTLTGLHPRFVPSTVQAPWVTFGDDKSNDNAISSYGLCRTATQLSLPFSYSTPSLGETDAIVHDPLNLSGSSNFGCSTAQNETTIAVNPTNPSNLVAGANDYRVCCDFSGLNDGTGWAYYSFDGGHSWGNVQVPGLTAETGGTGVFKKVDSAGDPVMTFGPDGTVYYANLVFSRVSPASGVVVSKSTDGGKTWSAPAMVAFSSTAHFFNDKEWIAAGANGKVVVSWTRFNQGPQGVGYIASPIVAATSSDFGNSWSSWFNVSDHAHPYNQGSQVAYAPNGDLYVSYEAASPLTGYATDVTAVARSTNNGASFSTAEIGRVYDDLDCYPIFSGRQTLSNQHFRLNSYPSMSIDPATGQIAISWADDQGAGNCGTGGTSFTGTTSNQVKLVSGTWGSFSAPKLITPDSADKAFPSVAIQNGKTVVSYYTAGYSSSNPACFIKIPDNLTSPGANYVPSSTSVCLDYAARTSLDSFGHQSRLTSEGSNPYVMFANGSFIGDYTQVAIGTDGVGHAAWTDFRGNPGTNSPNQDVYVNTTP